MVCCALIAGFLGMLTAFFRSLIRRPSALHWRLANKGYAEKNMATSQKSKFSFAARFRSFGFAFDGLKFVFTHEHNMRIHGVAAVCAVAAGVYLRVTVDEWRWIILAVILVLVTETINTAIEQTCNAFGGKFDEHIRNAKDVAAAAVLLTSFAALALGMSVFMPYLRTVDASPSPISYFGQICDSHSELDSLPQPNL